MDKVSSRYSHHNIQGHFDVGGFDRIKIWNSKFGASEEIDEMLSGRCNTFGNKVETRSERVIKDQFLNYFLKKKNI